MTDIVDRLRAPDAVWDHAFEPVKWRTLMDDAAAEIVRLRALVDVLAAWAIGVDYQQASIPAWVRAAIDKALE